MPSVKFDLCEDGSMVSEWLALQVGEEEFIGQIKVNVPMQVIECLTRPVGTAAARQLNNVVGVRQLPVSNGVEFISANEWRSMSKPREAEH